ncbi:hypothetical protein MPTK1_2g08930 [Marchantia polymorpha subsp. ruderalis]|uniref:Uncharacterized protein n=1 Tax=Marchantia polymorpha TaxID=3197 RepID=A0A2R6XH23_MARPO|nr:hypothetical protein MARPO_0015s0177 [Marchantia polymorpha]BBN01626.1 hypothetical protein Mp_2g08930 [Marchantia polymorpha subsp. ruderalis]|eukprot:PTQ45392.1 hypothetical protein MARPO_0015s0177 [Marchantia polymorpha]
MVRGTAAGAEYEIASRSGAVSIPQHCEGIRIANGFRELYPSRRGLARGRGRGRIRVSAGPTGDDWCLDNSDLGGNTWSPEASAELSGREVGQQRCGTTHGESPSEGERGRGVGRAGGGKAPAGLKSANQSGGRRRPSSGAGEGAGKRGER